MILFDIEHNVWRGNSFGLPEPCNFFGLTALPGKWFEIEELSLIQGSSTEFYQHSSCNNWNCAMIILIHCRISGNILSFGFKVQRAIELKLCDDHDDLVFQSPC